MRRRRLATLALVAIVAAGCGGDAGGTGPPTADGGAPAADDDLVAAAEARELLDVRTPEEFAAGHLAGAANVDVQASDFERRVADLPRDAAYLVYCRTGSRATDAIERMRELGFTDLRNGGGFDELADAGVPTA